MENGWELPLHLFGCSVTIIMCPPAVLTNILKKEQIAPKDRIQALLLGTAYQTEVLSLCCLLLHPPPHSPTSGSPLNPLAQASPGAYIAPHIQHAPALASLQPSCHHQQFIPGTLGFQPYKTNLKCDPQTFSADSGSHQSTSFPQTRNRSYGLLVSSSDVTNNCANEYKTHHPQSQPIAPSTRSKIATRSKFVKGERPHTEAAIGTGLRIYVNTAHVLRKPSPLLKTSSCTTASHMAFVPSIQLHVPHQTSRLGIISLHLPWTNPLEEMSEKGRMTWEVLLVAHFSAMIQLCQYSAENKAASFQEANNDWIATHLQKLVHGVLEQYRQLLLESQLPSFAHMEYPTPYSPLDFASFFTFTMCNLHIEDHVDKDTNTWTLVCWIPIFNPLTSTQTDPILVDEGFDMIGGHFTFHDFQVYLDLNNVLGVTVCVFRSQDHTHQTLKGASPSDRYTRLGFSCQMSEKMSHAVVSYINTKNKAQKIVSGQQVQIDNAEAKVAKKNELFFFVFFFPSLLVITLP
ncbi:uncharacterized protein VP01_60g7 [Puccinia sorghi]|uniref:Tet-like 2OG-Fe(II) oxygenase domain-containing protein n=1 Tax=Puccinia sorghi TaxID=27349 RepID=A0A0L6UJ77_9BASI|nr:uncharacterized protein VP01_60g7 [Puccinia sorghi]